LTGGPVFACRTLAQLKKMQQEDIVFPQYLSEDSRSLIRSMLTYDHEARPSFQQLRGHAFFREVYGMPDISSDSVAASPSVHMDDPDEYELCEHESPEELQEEKIEDIAEEIKEETPVVQMEPKFADLASRTVELDSQVEHLADLKKIMNVFEKDIVKKAVAIYCNERIRSIFQDAENIASEFGLTRSKDFMFSELYEKIQTLLFLSNEEVEHIRPVDEKKLFEIVEEELKVQDKDLKGVKNKLELLEVVILKKSCPESLKNYQNELLKKHKELIRRNYF
jgi:serine/threonine protein kinase